MADRETETFFTNTIARDFFSSFVGKYLGKGAGREVYQCNINPDIVVKIETTSGSFQNILEWETWDACKETKFKKWFAPCYSISPCGTVLIQKYARDIEDSECPEQVPAFFSDIKKENWGIYNNLPVCRDYGRTLLVDKGLSNKLRKAEW